MSINLTVTEQVISVVEASCDTVEIAITETPIALTVAAGITDHGQLEGLEDDDHPQYLLRTDYVPGGDADTLEGHAASYFEVAGAASSAVGAHVAAANPHSQYLLVANYAPGISRIQDASDFTGSLTNGYVPTWSSAQSKFVMSAQAGGAPGGGNGQVQYHGSGGVFAGHSGLTYNGAGIVTVGTALVSPVIRPSSDSTAAIQFQTAGGTPIVILDSVNSKWIIRSTTARLEFQSAAGGQLAYLQSTASGDLDFNNIGNGSFRVRPAGGGGLAVYNGSHNLLFAGATVSNNTAVERLVLLNKSGVASNGIGNRIKFQANNSFANTRDIAYLDVLFSNATQGSEIGDFVFYTSIANTLTEAVRIQGGKFGIGVSSPTAWLHLPASTTSYASLRVPSGTAPTSPNSGDLWFDGTNLKFHDGSATRTLTWT